MRSARSNRLLLCTLPLVLALGGACNGFAPLVLSEVESVDGDVTTVKEMSYADDGRIEEIEITREGDFIGGLEFIWEGGQITALTRTRPGDSDIDVELQYEGGLLVGMTADDGNADYEIEISYQNDDARYLEEHTFIIEQNGSRTTLERTITYEDGRAVEGREESTIASGAGSLTFVNELELSWGDDGLPAEAELTAKAFGQSVTTDIEYKYTDDGRIEEADFDDGSSVEISYDDQGRMEEVEVTDDGDRVVHTLSYEEGSQSGFAFVAPGLPANVLFDLTGRAFPQPNVMTDAYFPVP